MYADRRRHLGTPDRTGPAECAASDVYSRRHDRSGIPARQLRRGGGILYAYPSASQRASSASREDRFMAATRGLLVATLSARPDPGTVEPDWLGAPMYFSGYSVEDNRSFVKGAGF